MGHHDFTSARLGWGRSFYLTSISKNKMRGLLHATPGPKVGDTCEWTTNYGTARGVLKKVRSLLDPDDMYDAEVKITERIVKP